MGSTTLVSLSEYLRTTYDPDCDFLEGEVRERNMGEQPHAHVQGILTRIFGNHRREWNVRALPEQRVQVRPNRFRIPDLCVVPTPGTASSALRRCSASRCFPATRPCGIWWSVP